MRYIHTAPDGSEITEDPLYALRHYYFNSEVHGMHYGEFANYAEYFAARSSKERRTRRIWKKASRRSASWKPCAVRPRRARPSPWRRS